MNHAVPPRSDSAQMTLAERTLAYLEDHEATQVGTLYALLQTGNVRFTEKEFTDLVWLLVDEGKVALTQIKTGPLSLVRYLRMWELNLFLYISLIVSFAASLMVYVIPGTSPFIILRWILGSLFVLFIPGYVAVEGLFGFAELDLVERIALSVGLSVALAMLVGLLLNYTPWGITLTPTVLALATVTVLLDVISLFERYSSS